MPSGAADRKEGSDQGIKGDTTMLAMLLSNWSDVRVARECAGALARAAGLPEP
jgi:hypothetical protein